jgi:subtilisin family serine protease
VPQRRTDQNIIHQSSEIVMSKKSQAYTYRNGEKVFLRKEDDEFVVRATPEALERLGIDDAVPVSSRSSRVMTRRVDLEESMESARRVAPTHHAYYRADTDEEFLITDRVFVTFREDPSPDVVNEFAGRYGLLLLEKYSERNYLFQLTDSTGINPVKLVVTLNESEPLVESADHDLNRRAKMHQFARPTDARYLRQWHLHSGLNDPAFDARASSRCEEAWALLDGFGSPDVVVGITDDGCRLDHGDFNSSGKFASWGYMRTTRLINKNDIDANPAEMYIPGANHGTSCAGVSAGEADGVLTVGAAPGCRLLPIQWESSGPSLFISDSKLLTVLNYVADKVDILSNSWGSAPDSTWQTQVRNRIAQLAQTGGRRGRGIVFLWAAGNENCPVNHDAAVDVPYDSGWQPLSNGTDRWVGVSTARRFRNNLADIPGVMHVAALASNAQRSHYSNYGTGVSICAPSSNSHAYWRMNVTGLGVTTASGSSTSSVTNGFGGTSSATPLTAGIAALVISANPELTGLDVISILEQTASKDLSPQGYPRTTPIPQDTNTSWDVSPISPFDTGAFIDTGSPNGTWSPWFGHGRVDAHAAVADPGRREGP